MKYYVNQSPSEEIIVNIWLSEDEFGYFYAEFETDSSDVVVIRHSGEYYILETNDTGLIYKNKSLYEVLVHFTDRYDVSYDFVRKIFKCAREHMGGSF